jgi:hypothetical protein
MAVTLFGMSLDMEDVSLRGEFQGFQRRAGARCRSIQVNWIYGPIPPKPQQVYPEVCIEAVTDF